MHAKTFRAINHSKQSCPLLMSTLLAYISATGGKITIMLFLAVLCIDEQTGEGLSESRRVGWKWRFCDPPDVKHHQQNHLTGPLYHPWSVIWPQTTGVLPGPPSLPGWSPSIASLSFIYSRLLRGVFGGLVVSGPVISPVGGAVLGEWPAAGLRPDGPYRRLIRSGHRADRWVYGVAASCASPPPPVWICQWPHRGSE